MLFRRHTMFFLFSLSARSPQVEVNACQVLLHKLDSSQDNVVQKVDTQKVAVDNLLNSITGAIWTYA